MGYNCTRIRGVHRYPVIPHIPIVYDDWFLPSKDELNEMRTELYLHGVGNFDDHDYWTSSEYDFELAWVIEMLYGWDNGHYKYAVVGNRTRACRTFTSTTSYALRDIGPAGGYIFWKSGNDYLEAAPTDQSSSQAWSNITNLLIGTTGSAIGTGQANTTAIINQAGHTDSAAKLCDDLII
jgi:hypothetical protein